MDRIPRLGTGPIVGSNGAPHTNFQWWLNTAFKSIETSVGALATQLGLITAAQSTADAANLAAVAAQADADAANAAIGTIASDGILSVIEKKTVVREVADLLAEQSDIDAKATVYAITTEKTAYDNSLTALSAYLATLTTPNMWNSFAGNTTVTGTTFRTTFSNVYAARQTLLNKIALEAGKTSTWVGVTGTGRPADNATVNVVTYSATAPASPVDGDIWVDTAVSPNVTKVRVAGAWQIGANFVTNTNQVSDGANLGGTAIWTGVTGTGRPADNATVNIVTYSSSAPSTPTNGDIWVDTSTSPNVTKVRVSGAWQIGANFVTNTNQVTDGANLGGTAVWTGVTGTGRPADNATVNRITYSASAPASPVDGDLWVDTSVTPNLTKVRVSGAWQISANYSTNTNQLTDGANLGGTAVWTGVTSRPTELTDGRITAGLDSSGDLVRNLTTARLNGSNVLRRTSGGLFSGDLTATEGATWGTNVNSRPTELTDGRIGTALNSGGRLRSAGNLFTSLAAGVRSTVTVILTATDAGTNATIAVSAHTRKIPGESGVVSITYNSGSITGLAFSTRYFIYADDATQAGGAVTYIATTNSDDLVALAARVYMGEVTTPADGGTGETGGGGGGIGGGGGGGDYIP